MWLNCQVILEWAIDTVNMTLSLPPHHDSRFKDIMAGIPTSQKRTEVDKWHRVLVDLSSIDIFLPGARCLFIQMQEALHHVEGK